MTLEEAVALLQQFGGLVSISGSRDGPFTITLDDGSELTGVTADEILFAANEIQAEMGQEASQPSGATAPATPRVSTTPVPTPLEPNNPNQPMWWDEAIDGHFPILGM